MNNPKDLDKLQAEDYLKPEKFRTNFDNDQNESVGQKKYEEGLTIGSEMGEIHISNNSVWSANGGSDRGVLSSYEKIGFHLRTAELLQGFLDSGANIIVHRFDEKLGFTEKVIKTGNDAVVNDYQKELYNMLKEEDNNRTIYLLEPLKAYSLDAQLKMNTHNMDTPMSLGQVEPNEYGTYYYNEEKNVYFVLSNFDINEQNIILNLKNSKTVEKNANVVFVYNNEKEAGYSKKNKLTQSIGGQKLNIYPQPKQVETDTQKVFVKIPTTKKGIKSKLERQQKLF